MGLSFGQEDSTKPGSGFTTYTPDTMILMHYCSYHKTEEPDKNFKIKDNGRLDSWCREGRKEYGRRYSKKAYAPIKEEVAERRSAEALLPEPSTRVCIDCPGEKLLSDFPFRPDRPGKRFTRCTLCQAKITRIRNTQYSLDNSERLTVWRKAYQAAHPGYNRESTRRRRTQLKNARNDRVKDAVLRARDKSICCFCGEFVDPTIPYVPEHPDPKCEVVNHYHPIALFLAVSGPRLLIAHHRCNGRAGNNYTCPFKDWEVKLIDNSLARETVEKFHYLHRKPNCSFGYGLFSGTELKGVVTFGTPSSMRISMSACPSSPRDVIELSRLWIDDEAPFGAASWFVSRALKLLPAKIVVSYADTSIVDPRYGTNHDGTVYTALSFNYAGLTKQAKEWVLPGKNRNVGKHTQGSIPKIIPARHRFWTVTGNKREKKLLRRLCAW